MQEKSDCCRPLAFWSLNHKLEKEELDWQIRAMRDKGLAGFFMHPRSGLLTPYMSEEWLDAVGFCIEKAAEYGMEAWLYDEDPYPSGISGGRVTADHPEYRCKLLKWARSTVRNGHVSMEIPLKKIIGAFAVRFEKGKIAEKLDITAHMGTVRTDWGWTKRYFTYYPTTEAHAKPQMRSDAYHPHYLLECSLPAGEWEVYVFYYDFFEDNGVFGTAPDLLNPEAVRYYIQINNEPYKRFFKYFGNVVPGIFTDEPKFYPYPWTEGLPELFEQQKGYPIYDSLIALCTDIEGGDVLRKDFWEVCQNRFIDSYVRQVGKWCEENGLILTGHCSPEEDPCGQVILTGSVMQFMKGCAMPCTDLITEMIGSRDYPIVNLGTLLTSSVSRQWWDGRAACETFAVMEYQLTLRDMFRVQNWLFATGISTIVMSTFVYSIDGYRKYDAGPSEFYQMPCYPYFDRFSDYSALLGKLLFDSEPIAPVALLYPMDSFMTKQIVLKEEAVALRGKYTALFTELLRHHIQFEFVDYLDYENARVEGGLIIGKRRYEKVILPPMYYISEKAQSVTEKLRQEGVPVYGPITVNGNEYDGYMFENLESVLDACRCELSLSGDHADLLMRQVVREGKTWFFLFNPEKRDAVIQYRYPTPLCVFDPETGEWYGAEEVTIEAGSALFLTEGTAPAKKPVQALFELSGEWQFTPCDKNCVILEKWRLYQGQVPTDHFENFLHLESPAPASGMGVTEFPKTLTLITNVFLDGIPESLELVRETSAVMGEWEIFCNGIPVTEWKKVRYFDCNNFSADLIPFIIRNDNRFYNRGELTIAVRVTVRDGSEGLLCPLRLYGDFTLSLNNHETVSATLTPWKEQSLKTGSWTYQGYPQYSGAGIYTQTVDFPAGERFLLSFDTGNNPAEVFVNGSSAAFRAGGKKPLDISGFVREGENTISIKVTGTAENHLFNSGAPCGLLSPVIVLRGEN